MIKSRNGRILAKVKFSSQCRIIPENGKSVECSVISDGEGYSRYDNGDERRFKSNPDIVVKEIS